MPQTTRAKNSRLCSGFSLVEMTVVILVLAVISTMGISMFREKDYSRKTEETRKRLETIENALMNYRNSNQRLPCPANGAIADGALNYGAEGKYPGNCMDGAADGLPVSNFVSGETVAGVVPTRTLQLPDDLMLDGWGRRITYAVDRRMTHIQATLKFGVRDCSIGSITVNDAANTARTTRAVYALLSHGENGHGAFLASGVRRNFKSTNAIEQANASYNASGVATPFTGVFTMKREEKSSASVFNTFDDIMVYKERWALANAADLMITGTRRYLTTISSRGENPDHARTHTCAVDESGFGYCWGHNGYSQLGTENTTDRSRPVIVNMNTTSPRTLTGFTDIRPGGSHTCGLGRDSKVYCWGRNQTGQTGPSWFGSGQDPIALPATLWAQSISVGDEISCAIANNDRAYCTGNNVGDGTNTTRWAFTAVAGGHSFKALYPGHQHTCGITLSNKTYCWGSNNNRQLGDGTTTNSWSPREFTAYPTGVSFFKKIQTGGHDNRSFTCALADDNAIYCWGQNENGRFGNGNWNSAYSAPTRTTFPTGVNAFLDFSISAFNGCALDVNGMAYCWGGWTGDGSAGGDIDVIPTAVTMPTGVRFTSITSGKNVNCAQGSDLNTYCWGRSGSGVGQIGDGTTTDRLVPTRVEFPPC